MIVLDFEAHFLLNFQYLDIIPSFSTINFILSLSDNYQKGLSFCIHSVICFFFGSLADRYSPLIEQFYLEFHYRHLYFYIFTKYQIYSPVFVSSHYILIVLIPKFPLNVSLR